MKLQTTVKESGRIPFIRIQPEIPDTDTNLNSYPAIEHIFRPEGGVEFYVVHKDRGIVHFPKNWFIA